MRELVAAVSILSQGAFVAPGETFTVDDENAAVLIAQGAATSVTSPRKRPRPAA